MKLQKPFWLAQSIHWGTGVTVGVLAAVGIGVEVAVLVAAGIVEVN